MSKDTPEVPGKLSSHEFSSSSPLSVKNTEILEVNVVVVFYINPSPIISCESPDMFITPQPVDNSLR